MDDPDNHVYLKLSHTDRRNSVNTSRSSPQLLLNSLKSDELYGAKLGFKYNQNFIPDSISDCLSAHISSKYETNFSGMSFLKTHAFIRRMATWKCFQMTSSLQTGWVKSFAPNNQLMVNDAFYFQNFKGISNIGNHPYSN